MVLQADLVLRVQREGGSPTHLWPHSVELAYLHVRNLANGSLPLEGCCEDGECAGG